MTPAEAAARGIPLLPQTLIEALGYLSKSEWAGQILGNHIMKEFVREKEAEWNEYMMQVSGWELEHYLPKF